MSIAIVPVFAATVRTQGFLWSNGLVGHLTTVLQISQFLLFSDLMLNLVEWQCLLITATSLGPFPNAFQNNSITAKHNATSSSQDEFPWTNLATLLSPTIISSPSTSERFCIQRNTLSHFRQVFLGRIFYPTPAFLETEEDTMQARCLLQFVWKFQLTTKLKSIEGNRASVWCGFAAAS